MAAFYQKFLRKHLDLSSLSVMRREDNDPYFCTPKGASIFGWAGVASTSALSAVLAKRSSP